MDFTLEKGHRARPGRARTAPGKSTLMLILGGVYRPDAGEILLEGKPAVFSSAFDANRAGISVVYQELSLVPNLSVAENIFARRQPVRGANLIDWDRLHSEDHGAAHAVRLGETSIPARRCGELSIAKRQVVEILKAMSVNPKILILDEPTSSLTEVEARELFANIRKLKARGISDHLHLPPPAGDLRDRRHGDHPARRPARLRRAGVRHRRGVPRHQHGGPQDRQHVRRAAGREAASARRSSRPRGSPARASSPT